MGCIKVQLFMSLLLCIERRYAAAWVTAGARIRPRRPAVLSFRLASSSSEQTFIDQELTEAKRLAEEALGLLTKNQASSTPLDVLRRRVADLEREQSDPSFWDEANASRASTVNAQLSSAVRLVSRLEQWQSWQGDVQAAMDMLKDRDALSVDEQRMLLEELSATAEKLLKDSADFELELLLSGPYDAADARMVLTAGAGGTEANDWVADLKRMYERHAEKRGYQVIIEDSQEGEVVGYKSVDMLIQGLNAYGWFQGEKGAHRLVRLSPFNANNKRQTTFAGVDVAPELLENEELTEIELPESELEITTMRSGGKGGQNVNKVNSAVRIKHLPSGLQVKCTQERSQSMNKDIAMQRLKSQLLAIKEEQRVREITEIRGDMVEAAWGQQIRNYVLHPYKMIKDQRTGWETSNTQAFLDGDLDECIGAYLRFKAAQNKASAEDEAAL